MAGKKECGPWDEVPGKCNARRPDGSGRCRQPAGWGVEGMTRGPCKMHGGATDSVKQHHQKAMAVEAVVTYGLPREVDPHTALLQEVWRTAGHVQWLASVIHNSDPDALVWGPSEEQLQVHEQRRGAASMPHGNFQTRTQTGTIRAAPTVWLELYRKERRHLVEVSKTAIACGIAERQVKLAEDMAMLMRTAVESMLDDMHAERLLAKGVGPKNVKVREIAAACFRRVTEVA